MQVNRYVAFFIFLFGSVGNILNIMVLSQRTFRSNSCFWLLLAASIDNLIAVVVGLSTQIIGGWTTDPTNYVEWLCKLRVHIVVTARTIYPWIMVLATIDRWLLSCTSARLRQKSSLKRAQQLTVATVIVMILYYLQLYYCYVANTVGNPMKCFARTLACRLLTDLSFALLATSVPAFLMVLFGLLTVSNIRQSQRRVQIAHLDHHTDHSRMQSTATAPANSEKKTKQKMDHALLRMVLVQVSLFVIFSMPLSLQKFYVSFSNVSSSPDDLAILSVVYNFILLISFIAHGLPFYIYAFLGGTEFRKALYTLFLSMRQKILCR